MNLEHTTIRSPVDGVVANRAMDVTKMQVEASVDEAEIGRLRAETPVTFTSSSSGSKRRRQARR